MPSAKYSPELLTRLVAESRSIADVLRKLGLALNSGGTHYHIARMIKQYRISTAHFLGVRANCGQHHKGGTPKRLAAQILTLKTSGYGEKTATVRRALLESGRPYICGNCGLGPEWDGKPLVLQIEHRNGNSLDDRPSNVVFLCPNCHTQTETYAKVKKCYGSPIGRRRVT